jgi:hypothetical protein
MQQSPCYSAAANAQWQAYRYLPVLHWIYYAKECRGKLLNFRPQKDAIAFEFVK